MTQTLERGADAAPTLPENAETTAPARRRLDNIILGCILAALSANWYYSWFHDGTHPIGGRGWADQGMYRATALRLADFHLPTFSELHFSQTYNLLAVPGTWITRGDQFWLITYALLIGSAIFLYRGARAMFNPVLSVLFFVSMFVWDGHARTFNYISELFAVPWNNQVIFFAYAFFFWLYATRRTSKLDMKWIVAMGVVVGLTVTTREEAALFVGPLAFIYLVYRKAPWRYWVASGIAAILAATPALLIKQAVLGSVFSAGPSRPGDGYTGVASGYFSFHQLGKNIVQVVIDSDYAHEKTLRAALFESSPWLWAGVVGVVILLVSRRYSGLIKWWVVMSGALVTFYLSGDNVSAAKLKFHCIRYLTPGLIALQLGVIVLLDAGWRLVSRRKPEQPEQREGESVRL